MQGYRVARLEEVPVIPAEEPGDPVWRPLQHYLRLEGVRRERLRREPAGRRSDPRARRGRERAGDELEGREGTVVTAAPEVVRSGVAMESGSAVFAVGAKPHGRFESTWRPEHFEDVPQAG